MPGYARTYRADELGAWLEGTTAVQLLAALESAPLEEVDLFPAAG